MKTLTWLGENTFAVWVKPRAARNQVIGLREGALHLHLTAPPVEGKANKALVQFLAEALGLRRWQIEVISGQKSRHKVVHISDIAPDELRGRVERILRPTSQP